MKNTARKIMAVMVCLTMILTLQPLAAPPAWASEGWTTVGNAGFSAGEVFHTDLVLDNSGTPYVTYEDNANGNKATVMKYNGHTWVPVGSPGFSAGVARYTDLALDESGTPYLAYQDGGNSNKATVMKYNGSAWVPVGSPGFSAGETGDTSLTLDESGTPYLAYSDGGNSYKATVMKYNGSNWETVGGAGFSAGEADYTSLALDESGTPYVVYRDGGNSNKATVMKYNGSAWVPVGSPGFSSDEADYTSLALDESGTPYVAYRDKGNSYKATVMKYNGSAWVPIGSAGFSAGGAYYTSLALDESGTPYVAYRDKDNSYKATVMKYNGSNWAPVGSAGFSAGEVLFVSLVTDGSGTPYLVYKDGGNGNKATLMKHDTTAPVLTAGGVSRSSDSEATVNFTSDEAGQYYYGVVAEGAAAPAIDTSGPGTACGTSEETITLTSLTAGGRDIYIKVKDAAGNVSGVLKITIPSLLAGTPALTAAAGDARINLNWTPAAGSVSYSVYQSTTPGVYGSALATVASSVYSYNAVNLSNGIPYYFMVKAVDFYGNSSSSNEVNATPHRSGSGGDDGDDFITSNPTIKTSKATSITDTTAALQGKIESDGNAIISEYGFIYGKDKSSLTRKGKAGTGNCRGSFSFGLSGLAAGTAYYYKAYAKSGDAELCGDVLRFTTEKAVQPEQEKEKQIFSDVPETHWAYLSINKLFPKGCVSGYPDGSFRPDAQITRAEFITILVKALDLKAGSKAKDFIDTGSHWAKDSVATAAGLGITGGYDDGSFKPDQPITREQMAVMAVKAAGLTAGSGETAFADNEQISSWAKGGVLAAVKASIMKGYPDNTFRPQNRATRAEAVSLILNLMK